jgi:FLVCR family MFS transporter 7
MDRFPHHAIAWRVGVFVALIGFLLFFLGTFPGRDALLYSGAAIIGLGGFPIEALSLEMGVESTWPVAEGTSAGLLWTSAQGFGVIFLFASDAFRHSYGDLTYALIFNIVVTAVAFLASLFYVSENRRRAVA